MITAIIAVTGAGSALTTTDTAYGYITTTADSETELQLKGDGTEQIVRTYFRDIPVMIQVARCESHFRHTLDDGSILKGKVDPRDTGVMQINKGYHAAEAAKMGLNLDDIYDNMEYARYLYEKQGTQPWSASSPCWGKTLAYNG